MLEQYERTLARSINQLPGADQLVQAALIRQKVDHEEELQRLAESHHHEVNELKAIIRQLQQISSGASRADDQQADSAYSSRRRDSRGHEIATLYVAQVKSLGVTNFLTEGRSSFG